MFNPDFYGSSSNWFVGIVVEVIDEVYVRVRVFGIHNMEDRVSLPDTDLPLALVSYPTTGGQSGSGSISHNLTVDSWVTGFFADGDDCQNPVVTGVINGTDYSMSTYSTQGGEFVQNGQSGTENPSDPSDPTGPDVDPNTTQNIPGGSNVEKAYNYIYSKLVSEGSSSDPHLHASAVIGVLQLESTPSIKPEIEGGYAGRAWGICQWLGGRKTQLFNKYGRTKRLDQQLDFMWWELNNTEKSAKNRWLQATNLQDAVAGFCFFERAEEYNTKTRTINRNHINYKKRLKFAYGIYNSAKYTGAATA